MKLNNSIFGTFVLLLAVTLTVCSCSDEDQAPNRSYQLVWEDEFDGAAGESPDATKWAYDIGIGPGDDGWGNRELQYYTDRPENISLDGEGNLAIIARAESFSGRAFTSARIKTKGLFEQAYGRYEARMKMPYGPGLWPAFWLLGANIDEVEWPQCGEIDVMEFRGQQTSIIHGSVHGPGYSGGDAITKGFAFENDRFDTDFHVYAVEWGEDYIDFFVDENYYQRITAGDLTGEWVFDQPFFMLLNVAVGGDYVGFPTDQTDFPQTTLIDWVRVYQETK